MMKKVLILFAVSALSASSCEKTRSQKPNMAARKEITEADLKTQDDRISYGLGFLGGSNIKRRG
jgi:hypothetical protein